ncbi:germin-like protein subfamily 1 member 18 [Selaginella moellendorffii]|uniref:germin-like protein subfamily 1 member 18 n=1 Tax=Selaginella moellendorffii TaxID=88036 RepID=UPI000D1C727F|nr:germin-like protein subfamily 1 member 18 [Selaginella moellendorffii]|eukprot:XP_024520836.1 germin-like protein subfamily 1 member 18 [Selaginella moellendorffii]
MHTRTDGALRRQRYVLERLWIQGVLDRSAHVVRDNFEVGGSLEGNGLDGEVGPMVSSPAIASDGDHVSEDCKVMTVIQVPSDGCLEGGGGFQAQHAFQERCSDRDEDALQDFCVRDGNSNTIVNGFTCKPAAATLASDFMFQGLRNPGNTNNKLGSIVTNANVGVFPGINTLGVSFARIDYAPYGVNPPHVHPRGTELLFLQQGTLYVGFVSTTNNTLFAQTLHPGDLFVFPRGLIHFQLNVGKTPAVALAGFNSQNPGVTQVAKAVFASNPPIYDAVIERAFQINPKLIQQLRDLIKQT